MSMCLMRKNSIHNFFSNVIEEVHKVNHLNYLLFRIKEKIFKNQQYIFFLTQIREFCTNWQSKDRKPTFLDNF